ncbi:hypothetical protein HYV86_02210 [Candidatus Woesearchaeota archaeon]|nr:hypothetical protein [Candidatus Woesearchaeota archaeon]
MARFVSSLYPLGLGALLLIGDENNSNNYSHQITPSQTGSSSLQESRPRSEDTNTPTTTTTPTPAIEKLPQPTTPVSPFLKTTSVEPDTIPTNLGLLVKCFDSNIGTMRFAGDYAVIVPRLVDNVPHIVKETKLEQYELIPPPPESLYTKTLETRLQAWTVYLSLTVQPERESGLACFNKYGKTYHAPTATSLNERLKSAIKGTYDTLKLKVSGSMDTIIDQLHDPQSYPVEEGAQQDPRLVIIPWTHDWFNYDRRFGLQHLKVNIVNKKPIPGSNPKDYQKIKQPKTQSVTYTLSPTVDVTELCYCGQANEEARDQYSDNLLQNTPKAQREHLAERLGRLEDNGCQASALEYQQFPLFDIFCSRLIEKE